MGPGEWQDNTYDNETMRGVDFVASNMLLKINSKTFTTEAVENLTVMVEGSNESGTEKRQDWDQ